MNDSPEKLAPPEAVENETTTKSEAQVSDGSLTEPVGAAPTQPDNWKGNSAYFQTGKKAGQLKPSAVAAGEKTKEFGGLKFDELNPTQTEKTIEPPAPPDAKAERAKQKAEKKSSDARVGAKIVLRILDTLVMWISGGTFGQDFTPDQSADRNKYRDELENDWREYLLTLDIPLHPALIAVAGSVFYVTPALSTPKGEARVQSMKEKIIGKVGAAIFSRSKK